MFIETRPTPDDLATTMIWFFVMTFRYMCLENGIYSEQCVTTGAFQSAIDEEITAHMFNSFPVGREYFAASLTIRIQATKPSRRYHFIPLQNELDSLAFLR
jgi:hypothetical protein